MKKVICLLFISSISWIAYGSNHTEQTIYESKTKYVGYQKVSGGHEITAVTITPGKDLKKVKKLPVIKAIANAKAVKATAKTAKSTVAKPVKRLCKHIKKLKF